MNPGGVARKIVVMVLSANGVSVGNGIDSDRLTVSKGDISEVLVIGKEKEVSRRMVHRLARIFDIEISLFYATLN
jgi:hypothetical protein